MNNLNENNNILEQLANDYMKEKRRKRRWGIVFKSLFAIIFLFGIFSMYSAVSVEDDGTQGPHTSIVDIFGPIFPKADASADKIAKSLRAAFDDKNTVGIILRVNSPGGSPVQADYVYNEIIRLRKLHPDIKVYAVCGDVCASAAYYIAASADKIYANPNSIVGSIGVLYNGFGFNKIMEKIGIDRRAITAGINKTFLDPFSPVDPTQEATMKSMLQEVHQIFIDRVKTGRGKRLQANNPTLFTGLFWTGIKAKKLGLIDDFASPGQVARDIIKNENIINYSEKPNYLERIAKQFSSSFSSTMLNALMVNQLS